MDSSALAEDEQSAGADSWPCPICTLINEADARLCIACNEVRPYASTANGKGKGRRVLRSRHPEGPPPPPPTIRSYADSLDDAEDDHSEEDDFDAPPTFTGAAAKKRPGEKPSGSNQLRRGRSRSGGGGGTANVSASGGRRRGRTTRSRANDTSSSTDSAGGGGGAGSGSGSAEAADKIEITAVESAAVDCEGGGERPTRRVSSRKAAKKLVELDDSDETDLEGDFCLAVSSAAGGGAAHESPGDEDGEERAGETPVLLGRGWSTEERELAKQRRITRQRELAAGGGDGGGRKRPGGAMPSQRGTKRQRPLPSYPGDDIFRSRKFAVDGIDHADSDHDGLPLEVRRRGGDTGGGMRSFWRWPPPPPPSEAHAADASSERDGDPISLGQEGVEVGNPGDVGSLADRSDRGCDSGGGGGEMSCGSGASGGSWNAGSVVGNGEVNHMATEALPFGSQTQEQNLKKKRSRLSLPKRGDNERGETAAASSTEAIGRAPPSPMAEPRSADDRAGVENDDSTGTGTGSGGDPSRQDDADGKQPAEAGKVASGGESFTGDTSARVEEGVETGPDATIAESRRNGGGDVGASANSGEGEHTGSADDAGKGRKGEVRVSSRVEHAPTGAAPAEEKEKSAEPADSSKRGTLAAGEAPQTAKSSPTRAGAGAGAGAPSLRMEMDLGSDDDSSDGSETQDKPDYDQGHANLSSAMDEAVESTAASSEIHAAVTSSDSPPRLPTAASSSKGGGSAVSPAWTPPRTRRGSGKTSRSQELSPESSSTGLVDTPPPTSSKARSRQSLGDRKSAREPSRPSKELEMLTRESSFSQSPAASANGGRGEWACASCTYSNRARAKTCEMCGTPKPATPVLDRASRMENRGGEGAVEDAWDGAADAGGAYDSDFSNQGLPGDDPTAGVSDSVESDGEDGGTECERDGKSASDRGAGGSTWFDTREVGEKEGQGGGGEASVVAASTRSGNQKRGNRHRTKDSVTGSGSEKQGGAALDVEGFAGNVEGAFSDSELLESDEDEDEEDYDDYDDDEDYEEEGASDNSDEEAKFVSSQIEERFSRLSQKPPPSKRRRRDSTADDEVLDLTEVVDEGTEDGGRGGRSRSHRSAAAAAAGAGSVLEEISDDDDFSIAPGFQGRGIETRGRGGSASGRSIPPTSPERKYRFFASVEEHRDQNSSCIDFSALAAPSAGGPSGAKSYDARKKARDAKAGRSKRGKKGKRAREPAARGRGAAGRGGRGRGGRGGARSSRSGMPPFSGGGGVPSASWIPPSIAVGLASSSGGGRRSGGVVGAQRQQPFNHYRGNDDVVDDSNGGGGFHWESAGRSTFGD